MKKIQGSTNKSTSHKAQKGLTLIKVLCSMTAITFFTAFAIPEYKKLQQSAHISSMVKAADRYAQLVDDMYRSGEVRIFEQVYTQLPPDITKNFQAHQDIVSASIEVESGTLRLVGSEQAGSYTLTATPEINGENLTWNYGGSCVIDNVCKGLFSDS